jgi:glutamyl-tRNA synthetase
MLDQGPSKNTNLMEWDKIWAINKDIIDPVAPRYTAVSKSSAIRLVIENGPEEVEAKSAELHPKNKIGTKAVMYGKELYIEREDAVGIEEGEKITLMKWGNVTISKKEIGTDGIMVLFGKVDPSDMDYKKTKKITWICADPTTTVEVVLVEYDHLITKPKVEDGESVKDCVNVGSKITYKAITEGCVRNL